MADVPTPGHGTRPDRPTDGQPEEHLTGHVTGHVSSDAEATPEVLDALDRLGRERMRLVGSAALLVCVLFFPLPVLGLFTDTLDGLTVSGLSWAWIYAFVQFGIALAVAGWYASRAARLDRDAAAIVAGRS